ncbi:MAG: hypothetical protein ACTHMM_18275 [Agriterribacter sp.]
MILSYTYKIQSATKYSLVDMSAIEYEVNYNPEKGIVDEIIAVKVFNLLHPGCGSIDITRLMCEKHNLDGCIDAVCDWWKIYNEALKEEKEYAGLQKEEHANA